VADHERGVGEHVLLRDPRLDVGVGGHGSQRSDVDVASLPQYQRQASESLFNDRVLLSMTHGELMSSDFQGALYDAVAAYGGSKNANAFIDTLQNSIEVPVAGR